MDNEREPAILMHLQTLVQELERKLENPKNKWKRREELQEEILDAQKRLRSVQRGNRRYSNRRAPRNYADRETRVPRPDQ